MKKLIAIAFAVPITLLLIAAGTQQSGPVQTSRLLRSVLTNETQSGARLALGIIDTNGSSGLDAPTVVAIMDTNNAASADTAAAVSSAVSNQFNVTATNAAFTTASNLLSSGNVDLNANTIRTTNLHLGITNAPMLATDSAGKPTASYNGGGLTNLFGVSTNVFYVSQNGATRFTGDVDVGIGADSGPAIQALLDQATNGPVEIIFDGKFITAQTLRIRSNTRLSAITPECGIVLSNNCDQWFMVCHDQNGNIYNNSNIVVEGVSFYGNSSNQVHHTTSDSPYYNGLYAPIKSTNQTALVSGGGVDYWDPWLMGVWFAGVDGLVVRDCTFYNMECFALTVGGRVRNAIIENNRMFWTPAFEGNQDGVHVFSPFDGVIRNIWSNGNDDTVGFNTDELSYVTNAIIRTMRGTNGNCGNVLIENIRHEGLRGGLIRLLAYNSSLGNNYVTNLTIQGVRGEFLSAGFICGPINSTWSDGKMYAHNLTIRDVQVQNSPVAIDLIGVRGKSLTVENIVGYGNPSYYSASANSWGSDRYTPSYIYLSHYWDDVTVNNVRFYTTSSETNVALVGTRYQFSENGIKNLSINNSSISGPGIRALVANHSSIDTLTINGVTSTNRAWIPPVYTPKEFTAGGTLNIANPVGVTNYAADTTLWLRRCRQIGYEPTPSRIRAVDWGLQFLASSGDLANMYEIGFFAGATNINEVLPKIRTYYTNEWTTNAFQINYSFTSSDLNRYGLTGGGSKYLDTQTAITTSGIGAAWKTNFGVGVYLYTIDTSTAANMSYAGASYSATGDNDRFSFIARPADIWLGSIFVGVARVYTPGLVALTVSNSTTTLNMFTNGASTYSTPSWNNGGFQSGAFWMMKGQYYATPATNTISFWYVGNGGVNQSNANYAARIMTEMAACYSPASIYSTGWTNYFAGSATANFTGGNVGITNQLGQTVAAWAAATNVTFTLKPGWVIGGSGMSGVATD